MMSTDPTLSNGQATENPAAWKAIVAEYQQPSLPRAIWQIVNTFGGYALLWYLMYWSWSVSPWITLPLAIVPLVLFTGNKEVMGELVNRKLTTVAAWLVAALIVALNLFLLYETLCGG